MTVLAYGRKYEWICFYLPQVLSRRLIKPTFLVSWDTPASTRSIVLVKLSKISVKHIRKLYRTVGGQICI